MKNKYFRQISGILPAHREPVLPQVVAFLLLQSSDNLAQTDVGATHDQNDYTAFSSI